MVHFGYFRKGIDGRWNISDGNSRKIDKIMILKDVFHRMFNESGLLEKEEIKIAPDIIVLDDTEKFHDANGNALDIEVRGARKSDQCYFKVKDVSEGFGMPKLYDTLIDKRSGYEEGIHYVYLYVQNEKSGENGKRTLYLKYCGIIRVLFASTTKLSQSFLSWATDTLFISQMGLIEDKIYLTSSLLGIPIETVKEILKKSVTPIACIYMFTIGTVLDLKNLLKYLIYMMENCWFQSMA